MSLSRRAGSAQGRAGPALFWLSLLIAAYFIPRGMLANPDSHLALTYAIVEEHTVRIDAYAGRLIDKAVYCGPHTAVRRCAHVYTDKAPGLSLLAAAIYLPLHLLITPPAPTADRFLLRLLLTLLTVSVPCALFAAAFWRFAASFVDAGAALLCVLGYALGSIALPYSMLLFSHALSAALLFSAFMLLYAAKRQIVWTGAPLVAGILAGYAIGCEYPVALIAALLGIYALVSGGEARRGAGLLARYCLGLAIGLAPAALYNTVAFGAPWALGYGHLTDPYYARGMAHGILGVGLPTWQALWGASFSPYRGLFVLSPWLLLAAPGLACMRRAGLGPEAALCLAICAVYCLFEGGYAFWDGGASTGPRHFLPALPFLVFPIAFAFEHRALRRLGAALVAVSAAILLLVVSTNPLFADPRYVAHVGNPLIDQTLRDLRDGRLQNNWGMVLRLPGLASLIPLGLAILPLVRRLPRGPGPSPAVQEPGSAVP